MGTILLGVTVFCFSLYLGLQFLTFLSLEWGSVHQGQWVDFNLPSILGLWGISVLWLRDAELLLYFKFTVFGNSHDQLCGPLYNMCVWAGASKAKPHLLQGVWRQQKAEFSRLDISSFMEEQN